MCALPPRVNGIFFQATGGRASANYLGDHSLPSSASPRHFSTLHNNTHEHVNPVWLSIYAVSGAFTLDGEMEIPDKSFTPTVESKFNQKFTLLLRARVTKVMSSHFLHREYSTRICLCANAVPLFTARTWIVLKMRQTLAIAAHDSLLGNEVCVVGLW
jgi:hypothetical protein